jgi:ABC-2 type transport system ATP-binding protein
VTFAIETSGLTRRYGRLDVVESLDLRVPAGSVFALVGPNGAGKTTTIKMLMNLVSPTRGSASVVGVDSRRLTWRELQRIGYVSENQQLPDWMTTAGLVAYCRPFYPTWDVTLEQTLFERFSLRPDVRLSKLSRGARMQAALLIALAFRPELVILDEPFSGLDPLVRDQLAETLLALVPERPFTIFVSSHDLDEVERLANWIAFIHQGRVLMSESVSTLVERFSRADGSRPSLREIFLTLATSPRERVAEGGARS